MTTELTTFLENTRDRFSDVRSTPLYISVPAHHSGPLLPEDDLINAHGTTIIDPFALFTDGLVDRRTASIRFPLVPPYLVCVVGDYGLGKTELIRRLGAELWDLHIRQGTPAPLAVSLGRRQSKRSSLLGHNEPEEFARALFGVPSASSPGFVSSELLPAIRSGRVLVFLDGLDELVFADEEHNVFFDNLARMLLGPADGSGPLSMRLVIGVRMAYFRAFTNASAAADDEPISLFDVGSAAVAWHAQHFVRLLFFEKDDVLCYLAERFGDARAEEIFDRVEAHPSLLGMLRRPLLLSLFCQLADGDPMALDELIKLLVARGRAPAAPLVETFVESASADRLREEQELFGPIGWDVHELSTLSLAALRRRENRIAVDDLKGALRPIEDHPEPAPPVDELSTEDVLKSIHKCPFLRMTISDSGKRYADFAHTLFFDYFVAKGMYAELLAEGESVNAFDELVLPSTEMRQFLRHFMDDAEPGRWFQRTALSYGFREWPDLDSARKEELDRIRRTLLDGMTYPEEPPDDVRQEIDRFLEVDGGDMWLHPKYRMYNYEAVAVWLSQHRLAGARLRRSFEDRLDRTWRALWGGFVAPGGEDPPKAEQLLFERVLDIGRRLHMRWAPEAAKAVRETGGAHIRDDFVRQRTVRIANEIARITS